MQQFRKPRGARPLGPRRGTSRLPVVEPNAARLAAQLLWKPLQRRTLNVDFANEAGAQAIASHQYAYLAAPSKGRPGSSESLCASVIIRDAAIVRKEFLFDEMGFAFSMHCRRRKSISRVDGVRSRTTDAQRAD